MFSKLDFSPADAGISTRYGQTFGRVGGDPGFTPPPREPTQDETRPAIDDDDWAPLEPVAPPSDIALGAVALIPVWAGIAWVIYTLIG